MFMCVRQLRSVVCDAVSEWHAVHLFVCVWVVDLIVLFVCVCCVCLCDFV